MKTILIVDDDMNIGNMLEEILIKEGYQVVRAYSGTEALLVLDASRPDLILLDLMLPGLSGEEALARIKGIPVIVLSAKTDIDHKVELLLDGAADYVTKPFQTKELLARIVVQLRNADSSNSSPESMAGKSINQVLKYDDLIMDTAEHCVMIKDCKIRLTKTEYAILKLLMLNQTQVIPKSTILDRISEDTPDCMESSLKVHISNLRRKLREVGNKDYIEAVWGIGFKMKTIDK